MSHKKGGGSTSNGRDSNSKRLGFKKFGGEHVIARQHYCCANVGLASCLAKM